MADRRLISQVGDTSKHLAAEDGRAYRVFNQAGDAIKRHVRYLHDKVNSAPASGNKNRWSYAGSIPMVLLLDWLKARGMRFDQYARNEDNAREKFVAWLKSTHPALLPKAGASARPSIVVPTTYTPKKNATVEGSA